MKSLFNDSTIETIKRIKKGFLWTAVCILIGEVVVGAILIIIQSFDLTIGKLMGTFALCSLMLFLGVNNFSLMEKKDRIVQSFALTSLIGNIVWLLLAVLFIWEVLPFMEKDVSGVYYYSYHLSAMAKMLMVAINIAVMCFLISNVWAIEESLKPVKPLKITAIICALYCGIYAIVVTLGEVEAVIDGRWYGLAGLAGFAFVVMACAASIVSKCGLKKEKEVDKGLNNVNNAEVQASIQEMVEREVQARMATMQGGAVMNKQDDAKMTAMQDGMVASERNNTNELKEWQGGTEAGRDASVTQKNELSYGREDGNQVELTNEQSGGGESGSQSLT